MPTLSAQSSHCIPGQVENGNNDLWSEECYLDDQCELQGNPCAANDVTLLGVYVADSAGGPIATHHLGDVITFYLWGTFENHTGTDRHAVRTVSEVIVNGEFSTEINSCSFDVLGPGLANSILLEEVTYICGDQLQLLNTWVGWSTSHGQCSDPTAPNYRSECGQYPPSQCSKDFDLLDFLAPNFQFYCGEAGPSTTEICFTNTSTGGTPPLTFDWDFGDGNSSTEENPCHTYAAISGNYTILLTVTDSNGVQASAELMLDLDSLNCCFLTVGCPPIDGGLFECPEDVPVADTSLVTVTDSCGPVSITLTETSNGSGCIMDTMFITRQYVITDGITTDTCTQIFRVLDSQPPALQCPADITITCVDDIPDPAPETLIYTENCSGSSVVTFLGDAQVNQTCMNRVTIERSYLIVDSCGNADTCKQLITVYDDTPPMITCPADLTVDCQAAVPLANTASVTTSDSCGGSVSVTVTPDVISNQVCENHYTITRTYKATDLCGNTATCTQTITVFDSIPPFTICPTNITVSCAGDVPLPNTALVFTGDNCEGLIQVSVTQGIINQECANRYTIERNYTATDFCGNTTTCTQLITVNDLIPPTITCPDDMTVTCSDDVPLPNISQIITSDNCGGNPDVIFVEDIITNVICANQYTVMRVYMATDLCGNTATCTQLITVNDDSPPSLTCPPNITVACTSDVPVPDTDGVTVSNNCDTLFTVTVSPDLISNQLCEDKYTITRIYTATDICGNSATCVQLITVNDTIAPTISCPDDVTVTCTEDVPAPNTSSVVTIDNCGGSVGVTMTSEFIDNQICENQYTLIRIYMATDQCGNTATCAQTITVADNISPEITCPADLTVDCQADVPLPNTASVTTSDNCGGSVNVTVSPDVISNQVCENHYTITRTYVATDACGNSASCIQTITVFDSTPPVVTCPADITIECSTDVPDPNPSLVSGSDNCGGVLSIVFTQDIIQQQLCTNRYSITRIYTATDLCGNSATCSQMITVFDSTPPSITCPADMTVTCSDDVPLPNISQIITSDNCGGNPDVIFVEDIITNVICANQYTVIRVYMATDLCGNTATCTQLITVNDDSPPSLTCPPNITVACTSDVPVPDTDGVTVINNCDTLFTVTVSPDLISNQLCEDNYTIIRIYTATDICGNSATCVQLITVNDTIAPTISCPADVTVTCTGDVPAPNTTSVVTSDNCGGSVGVTMTSEFIDNQICENQYTLIRIYMATDQCGNTATCAQTITVADNISPEITCPADLTVDCQADLPLPNTASVTTSDNCGGSVNVTVSPDVISNQVCENHYTITRTYVATDLCGNTGTCTQTITVFDSTPPIISCPNNLTVTCAGDVPLPNTASVLTGDNCEGLIQVTVTQGIINQECANRYTIERIYTATDVCGNTASCTQLISVNDLIPPTITCPSNITVACSQDVPAANTSSIITTDNCGGIVIVTVGSDIISNQLCENQYTITRIYTATDACGNSATCLQTIIVNDNIPPSIVAPPDVSVECANEVPAANSGNVLSTDNCNGAVNISHAGDVISNQNCVNQFVLTRTYQASDACGNTATDTQIISVGDFIPPVISFIDPLIAGVPDGGTVILQCYGQDPLWDLPALDHNSVNATDNCGVKSINFSQSLVEEGNCLTDGFINIMRLDWTAIDSCENQSVAHVFLKLVDTIPPVIHDVPADITVNANNIPPPPNVYATDECLCSCIVYFENFSLSPGCVNGKVMRRSWQATDDCGNVATATQLITLVDEEGPELLLLESELAGIENGDILEFTCNEGGIPSYFNSLDEQSILAVDHSGPVTINFNVDRQTANNCEFWGYVEQRIFNWEAVDECGNRSALSFTVKLIDNEPPVLTGVPDMACFDDEILNRIEAIDNCGHADISYWDVSIPNPCGNSPARRRTYEATDPCGNIVRDTVLLIPDDEVGPVIEFVNPALVQFGADEVMEINCDASNGYYTQYGVEDVKVTDPCPAGVHVIYEEIVKRKGDCTTEGFLALIEMRWTATDVCGNLSSLSLNARIVDNSPPELINFDDDVVIGCNEDMPQIEVKDNCGEVIVNIQETIIPGACQFEYDVLRSITVTDECMNSSTALQTVHVGDDSGPVIEGVEEELCDDLSLPLVTAFDPCVSGYVEVTMVQDTLETSCREGLVIERTWSATDACGDVTEVKQQIIIGDITPPEIMIPTYSIIHKMIDQENSAYYSQVDIITALDALDESSVYVQDDCDQQITPVFSIVSSYAENCKEEGYYEQRTYTWLATDVCGNTSSISFTIDLIDDIAPVFENIPKDETIICNDLVPPAELHAIDQAGPVIITYTESTTPVNSSGEYYITRMWIATDACGNSSVATQNIKWIPDTYISCDIITPNNVECNTHGILISSNVTGGIAPFTYLWEIVGEDCFIQGGQNTPEIFIYIGWSPIEIRLTVTDAYGCSTVCTTSLDCIYSLEDPHNELYGPADIETDYTEENPNSFTTGTEPQIENLSHVNVWPNPAKESVYLSYDSSIEDDINVILFNLQGQVIMNKKIKAYKGFNSEKIDVSQFNSEGIMLKITSGKEVHFKMIVIIK